MLVDEIWHAAGDKATDIDWYLKRTILGGIYSTTELYMLTDNSQGCNSTTCAYADYTRTASVLTTIATDSTCPAPRSSATRLQGWRWNGVGHNFYAYHGALYFLS
ncbi:hypothetical protein ACS0TY_024154 [Phlomoides rotata]